MFVAFTVLWNVLIHTAFWLVWFNRPQNEMLALAALGFFALIGLLLIYQTVVKWLRWRRFGEMVLHMDPFPGSIGGEIGGTIEVPLRYAPGGSVDVKLSCIQIYVTGGRKRKRRERVLWREQATLKGEPGMHGTRFRFKFTIPKEQSASEEPSDSYTKWTLHVGRELKGADIEHTFELLVLDDGTPRMSTIGELDTVQSPQCVPLDDSLVQVEKLADSLRVFYPASRGRATGVFLLLFAWLFAGVPVFFFTMFSEFGSGGFAIVFQLIGMLFGAIFTLIGVAIMLFALYMLFNSLTVQVTPAGVSSERRMLGLRSRSEMALHEIESLSYSISGQSGSSATATVEYQLQALGADAKALCLGDGIKGKPLADKLMRELSGVLKHAHWKQGERRRRFRRR